MLTTPVSSFNGASDVIRPLKVMVSPIFTGRVNTTSVIVLIPIARSGSTRTSPKP